MNPLGIPLHRSFYLSFPVAAVWLFLPHVLMAQPTITFSDPVPPANNTRVFALRCPGDLCLENCVFDLSKLTCTVTFERDPDLSAGTFEIKLLDSNGAALASTNSSLSNTTTTIRPLWKGTKEVTCDQTETLKLEVVATAVDFHLKTYSRTNTLEFALHCVGCEKPTRTEGNGTTKTEHSTADRQVRLGCVVINATDESRPVELVVNSASGWPVIPLPSPLLLTNGEARELFLEVIVPGGTVDGTAEAITLAAGFPGDPASASFTTMAVEVQTPLRLQIGEFDADGAVLLQVEGPWNAEFVVEWSDDLRRWNEVAKVFLLPGEEFASVPDPAPRPGDRRFYRARISAPDAR